MGDSVKLALIGLAIYLGVTGKWRAVLARLQAVAGTGGFAMVPPVTTQVAAGQGREPRTIVAGLATTATPGRSSNSPGVRTYDAAGGIGSVPPSRGITESGSRVTLFGGVAGGVGGARAVNGDSSSTKPSPLLYGCGSC